MKKYIFILLICSFTNAQQIQWASKVIKFSSDLGGKQFGIKRILGKPDVFPQGGYSPNAWTPKNALDGREVIIVGFEKPQTVKQVAVFENINAGCVYRISVSSDGEKFETAWTRKPDYKTPIYKSTLYIDRNYYFKKKRRKIYDAPNVNNPGIEHAIFDKSYNDINAVKVEFSFALLPGQKQVDAIGISDSEQPIQAVITTNDTFLNLNNTANTVFDKQNISNVFILNNTMYCSVTNNDYDKIALSKFEDSKWQTPQIDETLCNEDGYNYIEYINDKWALRGGATYTKGTSESGYDILTNQNGKYQKLQPLKITAFNNYNETSDATATDDGKVIILAIETDFTQGGSDLYFTTQKDQESYGLLQNMGKIVNSAAEEATPHLLSDKRTLLFSSDGYSGYGNFDLYVTQRLDDTWKNWSEPINLGNIINSSDFEGQPFYDEKNQILYYLQVKNNESKIVSIAVPIAILTQK